MPNRQYEQLHVGQLAKELKKAPIVYLLIGCAWPPSAGDESWWRLLPSLSDYYLIRTKLVVHRLLANY